MAYNVVNSGFKVGTTGVPFLLSTISSIDGTAVATTNLYTVPAGKTAVITSAMIRCTAMSAFVGVGTGGIGVAAGEDDIFPAVALAGLSAAGLVFYLTNYRTTGTTVAAGGIIKLGIDVAFVAGSATLSIDLIGYLI